MIWFTSDLHFFHRAVIDYAKRPFKDVDEMNEGLITKWNERVQPGDSVYVVGDFSFGNFKKTAEVYERLQGQKFLVRGNHDRDEKIQKLFAWSKDLYTVKVPLEGDNVQRIVLCHYPLVVWDRSHHGAWMLHGHSHGTLPDDPNALRLDIGVDCWNMAPVSFPEIQARMAQKNYKPVDHHGETGRD